MKDLTDNIKKALVGLGILALTFSSLEAQNYYCESKRGRDSGLNHFKKNNKENYCVFEKNRKTNLNYFEIGKGANYCVYKQAKRYHRHLRK